MGNPDELYIAHIKEQLRRYYEALAQEPLSPQIVDVFTRLAEAERQNPYEPPLIRQQPAEFAPDLAKPQGTSDPK